MKVGENIVGTILEENDEFYITIGKTKVKLTEEQNQELNLKKERKSPFESVPIGENYYLIDIYSKIKQVSNSGTSEDRELQRKGNYCTDREIIQELANREKLYRLLYKFQIENDTKEDNPLTQFRIKVDRKGGKNRDFYIVAINNKEEYLDINEILFNDCNIAKRAIEEVIKPHYEYIERQKEQKEKNLGGMILMNKVMNPEEFKKKMKEIQIEYECITHDTEEVHIKMDKLMCEVLENLGYKEGIEIFNNTPKWYS